MLGSVFTQTVTATGGTGSYVFSVSAGSLPAGLTLNAATGVISGTPTTAATSSFTITATGGGCRLDNALCVYGRRYARDRSADAAEQYMGTAYSQTISATGGTAPYAFAISAGTLPPG